MTAVATVPTLTVRRTIAASPEELFDAWLDPDAIAQWFCPGPVTSNTASIDARVGGRFEMLMKLPEQDCPHTGTYVAIDRPRKLVFTWKSFATHDTETLVTVDFIAGTKGTEVVVTHERLPDQKSVGDHNGGWTAALEKLGAFARRGVKAQP